MKSSPSSSFLQKWDENEKQHFNIFGVSGQVLLYSPWLARNVEDLSSRDKDIFPSMSTPFLQTEIDLRENMALKEL